MTAPTIAMVVPFPLDPGRGGVQRIAWNTGHYLASKGWKVVHVSLSPDVEAVTPADVSIVRPAKRLESERDVLDFLRTTLVAAGVDVAISQIGMDPVIGKALWTIRSERPELGIINAFHANPAAFRQNALHLVRNRLRHPLLRRCVRGRWIERLLLAIHRRSNASRFRAMIERCDRLMLLAPTFVEELRWYVQDFDVSKVAIIPNGFAALDQPVGAKEQMLLFVGRVEDAQKNVLMIPRIWARLAARLPDWQFHIVGDGIDRAELARQIEAAKLERIVLHGWQDPEPFYARARIFTMLSSYEGFGNTLIEAQRHGVVPVAFDSYSALRWILNDGRDASVVPAFDEDGYVRAVLDLAADDGVLTAMSACARANARRFSETAMGDGWHALASGVVAASKERAA